MHFWLGRGANIQTLSIYMHTFSIAASCMCTCVFTCLYVRACVCVCTYCVRTCEYTITHVEHPQFLQLAHLLLFRFCLRLGAGSSHFLGLTHHTLLGPTPPVIRSTFCHDLKLASSLRHFYTIQISPHRASKCSKTSTTMTQDLSQSKPTHNEQKSLAHTREDRPSVSAHTKSRFLAGDSYIPCTCRTHWPKMIVYHTYIHKRIQLHLTTDENPIQRVVWG